MSDTTNASQTRETTDTEKKVFAYLNDLRISGVCNMFGASAFVQDEFEDIGPLESRSLVSLWMRNFSEDGDYKTIFDQSMK